MLVIVINLASAKDRFAFQKEQLSQLGLPFHRLVAYTPDTIPSDIPESYWNTWQRPMTMGERACFLSHKAAWQHVAEDGPALILEDDAILANKVPELLKLIENQPDMDHLSLEVRGRRKLVGNAAIPLANGVMRRRLYLDRTGAAAYVLWPSGAQKLLKRAKRRAAIADGMICQAYELRSFQTDPACAVQIDMATKYGLPMEFETASTTGNGRRSMDKSFMQKMRRWSAQLRMGWRMFSRKLVAKRAYVPLKPEYFDD